MTNLELGQIGRESDFGVVVTGEFLEGRVAGFGHVVLPRLLKGFSVLLGGRLQNELGAENVAQFGTVTITATCHLLLFIVVVGGSQ